MFHAEYFFWSRNGPGYFYQSRNGSDFNVPKFGYCKILVFLSKKISNYKSLFKLLLKRTKKAYITASI